MRPKLSDDACIPPALVDGQPLGAQPCISVQRHRGSATVPKAQDAFCQAEADRMRPIREPGHATQVTWYRCHVQLWSQGEEAREGSLELPAFMFNRVLRVQLIWAREEGPRGQPDPTPPPRLGDAQSKRIKGRLTSSILALTRELSAQGIPSLQFALQFVVKTSEQLSSHAASCWLLGIQQQYLEKLPEIKVCCEFCFTHTWCSYS